MCVNINLVPFVKAIQMVRSSIYEELRQGVRHTGDIMLVVFLVWLRQIVGGKIKLI